MSSHATSSSLIARPRREPALRGARAGQAAVLTAIGLVLVAVMGLTLGTTGVFLMLCALPVPLFLLWMSADVTRADEAR